MSLITESMVVTLSGTQVLNFAAEVADGRDEIPLGLYELGPQMLCGSPT